MGVAPASFGNVCVGLYGLWHCAPEFHDISCDFGLAISNDGLHFREPVKGRVFGYTRKYGGVNVVKQITSSVEIEPDTIDVIL